MGGERAAGGADFHFPRRIGEHLVTTVHTGCPINPVTGELWGAPESAPTHADAFGVEEPPPALWFARDDVLVHAVAPEDDCTIHVTRLTRTDRDSQRIMDPPPGQLDPGLNPPCRGALRHNLQVLRKRRKTTVATAADQDSWQVTQGHRDGQAIFTRFSQAVGLAGDRADYGIQIGVAVPFVDPDSDGLPQGPEVGQLDEIEDLIVRESAGRAVLVGVITTQAMREFVLYSQDSEWIPEFHQALRDNVDHHDIQVMGQRDPDWGVYSSFVK